MIRVHDLPDRPALRADWVQTDRAAAAVAMAVMEQELGIPRLDVALHVFPSRTAFQDALLASGYPLQLAQDTASRMTAIGGFRRVLLNAEALVGADGAARAALVAHELTHSLQYELGGGIRGTSAQWLREGFADWVAGRVLAVLAVQSAEDFRARRESLVRRASGRLPALREMVTFPEWVELAGHTDAAAVSAKAFMAVDFLIARHGMGKVLEYFASFGRDQDSESNFERTFGEPASAFEAVLESRINPRAGGGP